MVKFDQNFSNSTAICVFLTLRFNFLREMFFRSFWSISIFNYWIAFWLEKLFWILHVANFCDKLDACHPIEKNSDKVNTACIQICVNWRHKFGRNIRLVSRKYFSSLKAFYSFQIYENVFGMIFSVTYKYVRLIFFLKTLITNQHKPALKRHIKPNFLVKEIVTSWNSKSDFH